MRPLHPTVELQLRDPAGPASSVSGLPEGLRASLAKHANLPAIEGKHTRLSYSELEQRSAWLARTLTAAGVRAGDRVPLLMSRSVALVTAQLAVLRLGAAYAPVDLASPPLRLQAMLDVLKASVVVTDGAWQPTHPHTFTCVNATAIDERSATGMPGPWHASSPNSPAYVMFTSGTTGVPKGVVVPQSGISRLVQKADFADFRPGARWGFLSSPAFDASTLEVWAPLLNGGCCVVQEDPHPSLDDLADFLLSRRITDSWLTAALFNALVEDRPDAFATLRQLLTGGERVSPRHARALLEAQPKLRLINGYGPTENTTFTLCHTITHADTQNPSGIPIGRPIRGTLVRVGTAPQESGEGELLAGGDGVALGYLDDPELTGHKFITLDGRRWYRSGDLVRRGPGGVFEFMGRADSQVKIQGHRVELEEVELMLAACPGVGNAAVMVRGDTAESRQLVACFSGLNAAPPSAGTVANFLSQRLPPPAVPRVLVPMANWPLNLNGKLDRAALALLVDRHVGGATTAEAAWQTDTERELAAVWQKCLPAARIHRQASFLALGGTSLTALRVSAQVRERFGRDLTPIDVLRLPVLADQARQIDRARPFSNSASVATATDEQLPLTQAQQSLLAACELDASGCAYLVHAALHIEGEPDRAAVRGAFEALAARHPALRMTTALAGNITHGSVHKHLIGGWWCEHEPLAQAPTDLAWPSTLLALINRPLDTARAGVMRVDIWPVAGGSCLLVWTVHHVSIDEASIDHCLVELDHLLASRELSPVYGSPLGFASLEKAWTDHDGVREWSQRLLEALTAKPPPLEAAPGPGRETPLMLPAELVARLRAASTRWGMTPFAPLLTAFGLALQDTFGDAGRFVSTPFSRRIEPELIEPAGYLLDLCLIEAGARPAESPALTLVRVQHSALALQRPSFLPRRALAEAIEQGDPLVARHINSFAFTWRLEPARAVGFGALRGRLLLVPQQGARFGLSLHVSSVAGQLGCSIEAIEHAFVDGRVDTLAEAFVQRLGQLCSIECLPEASDARPERSSTPLTPDPALATKLRTAWTHWVTAPPTGVGPATDFLQCGGNSLTVMRMAAQLQREHGLHIDPAAFLARPRFDTLCTLAAAPPQRAPSACIMVGPPNAPNVVMLIPGKGGQALGLYRLAEHLQRHFGDDHAMVVMDLEAMLVRVPHEQPLWFLHERMEQAIKEVGPQRIVAFAGFSLGGLLALQLARRFPGGVSPPVWLLDTYAPRIMKRSLWSRIERRIAHALLAPAAESAVVPSSDPNPDEADHGGNAGDEQIRPLWEIIHEELAVRPAVAPGVEVHLVQARQSVRDVGLLWRRSSSGFNPRHYGGWDVHLIDAMHLELPRSMAAQTAELLMKGLRRSRARTRHA